METIDEIVQILFHSVKLFFCTRNGHQPRFSIDYRCAGLIGIFRTVQNVFDLIGECGPEDELVVRVDFNAAFRFSGTHIAGRDHASTGSRCLLLIVDTARQCHACFACTLTIGTDVVHMIRLCEEIGDFQNISIQGVVEVVFIQCYIQYFRKCDIFKRKAVERGPQSLRSLFVFHNQREIALFCKLIDEL